MQNELQLLIYLNDIDSVRKINFIQQFFSNEKLRENIYSSIIGNDSVYENDMEFQKIFIKLYNKLNFEEYKKYSLLLNNLQKNQIHIISFNNDLYPKKLRCISDPPLVIYARGEIKELNNCISIVGTRSPSDYSQRRTYEISGLLSKIGYSIVSGLAIGIDTIAHQGALDNDGTTFAVLPGNIWEIIPSNNQILAEKIVKHGALLSEISSNKKMHKGRYIERNRITSGLSHCVIVMETHGSGGSLQQVKTAISQNKKIFSLIPDDSSSEAIKGHEILLKMGATPFQSVNEISDWIIGTKNEVVDKQIQLSNPTLFDFN